jgi:hypothetical protein
MRSEGSSETLEFAPPQIDVHGRACVGYSRHADRAETGKDGINMD